MLRSGSNPSRQRNSISVGKLVGAGIFLSIASIAVSTWFSLHHILQHQYPSHDPQPMPVMTSPYGLIVPEGPATALPSVLATPEEQASIDRKIYGGKGDKAHLGGFTSFDPMGVSPTLWSYMVNHLGIKSVLDVGCGRGISTSWFITHGLEYVGCAEGSHDAVTQSIIPNIKNIPERTHYEIIEHDFSRGPWWPSRTVDAVWCVEFTEHVGRNYQPNYLTAFRKAGLIFMTHSLWGGWHHVEVHDKEWWIVRMEGAGFVYSDILTKEARAKASADKHRKDLVNDMKKSEKDSLGVAQHLWGTLLVFINPLVVSRMEHAHLFAQHGCNSHKNGREQECGKEGLGSGVSELSALPDRFKPLPMTKDMDDQWLDLIKDIPL